MLVDNPGAEDALSMIGQALRLWYKGVGQAEARVLMQVEIADAKYRQKARAPLEKMIHHLANALQRLRPGAKIDAHQLSRTLLSALFYLKVSEQGESESNVESVIDQFVLLISKK